MASSELEAGPDRLEGYLSRHLAWSLATFGPGRQTEGILEHIEKELDEIRAMPGDLVEWVDVMILAMDGYLRHGGQPSSLLADLEAKQRVNAARLWPLPGAQAGASEHDRSGEKPRAAGESES